MDLSGELIVATVKAFEFRSISDREEMVKVITFTKKVSAIISPKIQVALVVFKIKMFVTAAAKVKVSLEVIKIKIKSRRVIVFFLLESTPGGGAGLGCNEISQEREI